MTKFAPDLERGSPRPFARITHLPRKYYGAPRLIRVIFIVAVLLFIGREAAIRIQGDFDYKLKILPTDFASLYRDAPDPIWHPPQPVRHLNGTNIDDRYVFMRHLGTGNEGSASLYVDVSSGEVVVVKFWTGPLKNIRNQVPESMQILFEAYTTKWPSEIEASLLLEHWNHGNDTVFVPVRDYFVVDHGAAEEWQWAMVTPFIEDGTLSNLASATKIHDRTVQKLDKIFRPAFNALLTTLRDLHDAQYCHDDIKPDNVFVANATHWLLGDLGNVRHYEHPWHATGRWKRENQKPDCKENDVQRLLKTYMAFLREAAGAGPGAFDAAFYAEDQAWSRLYWDYMAAPTSAGNLLLMSEDLRSGNGGEVKAGEAEAGDACLRRRVESELTFWSPETDWMEWLPFRGC